MEQKFHAVVRISTPQRAATPAAENSLSDLDTAAGNVYNLLDGASPAARLAAKNIKEVLKMEKYECVCGYVYDEEKGDPDGGIAPGTKFEDIPDDWVCPVCGLGKDSFTKI